ncbi:MAG TPA: beta-ketoacyl-ACP synthase II [Candidatus Egerieousia sp.]|nr:beta-ketoacyl-ACP synthase II [Candidatus Egerieousia sp.]HPT05780.1 beta-ketoacyl-ACP synthase II [Candidatus Egerieousia sp.]
MELKRVVITGIGTINPLGNNVKEFFTSLDNGVSGAGPITRFDVSEFKTKFACEVKNFDPLQHGLDRKEARKQDRYCQFAMVASDEAITDSKLDLEKEDKTRIGVIIGSGVGGIESMTQEIIEFADGHRIPRFSPFLIPKMIADMASGLVSIKYGFRGPNYATVSACASSSHAMCNSFDIVRLGEADIIVTGGAEAAIAIPGVGGFNSAQALSTRNDDPKTASRPFDKDRDGFVLGEGSAIVVLEEYEHAKARGAKIYAELVGSGMTADAYHITAPLPDGSGAVCAMKTALKCAGLEPKDIDYINVHGTSTHLGDIAELKAIKEVFGEDVYRLNISSTKSMTGHMLGAAGAVEALACIHAIDDGMVPPTINCQSLDPEIDPKLNLTLNKAQKREVRAAMNNTFGFGGHNSCLILKKICSASPYQGE